VRPTWRLPVVRLDFNPLRLDPAGVVDEREQAVAFTRARRGQRRSCDARGELREPGTRDAKDTKCTTRANDEEHNKREPLRRVGVREDALMIGRAVDELRAAVRGDLVGHDHVLVERLNRTISTRRREARWLVW
jgi:hypothetical protein